MEGLVGGGKGKGLRSVENVVSSSKKLFFDSN